MICDIDTLFLFHYFDISGFVDIQVVFVPDFFELGKEDVFPYITG